MSRRTLNWTDVKTPATVVGDALQEVDAPRLERGISVTKITSRGGTRQRVLTVSSDRFAIFCTHHPIKAASRGGGAGEILSSMASKIPLPWITRHGVRGFTSDNDLRDRFVRYIDVADLDWVLVGVVGTLKLENARELSRLKGLDSKIDQDVEQIVSIFHHGSESLNVLVPNAKDRQELVDTLRRLRAIYHAAATLVSQDALLLRYIWYDVDYNRDGNISESEFVKILSRINLSIKNPGQVYRDFAEERGIKGALSYGLVMTLLQQQKKQGENKSMANQLWDELFDDEEDIVGVVDFLTKFCHGAQGEMLTTMQNVHDLFAVLNSMEINHAEGEPQHIDKLDELSRARFEVFLYHNMNSAYDPAALEADSQPLLKPIARYWISTSHNTYLTGDQLASKSSVEMYLRALHRGCHCLELDVWDGEMSPSGEPLPVVYHGHTVTSKILFVDIVRAVKVYMDQHPNMYPVILSLENHCSHSFQFAMASILKDILGEILYVPTKADKNQGDLPSPEAMRGKVVIKGKRPPDEEEELTEPTESTLTEEFDQYTDSPLEPLSPSSKKGLLKLPKIVKELADMTLFHGTMFKEFEISINEPRSHMHSVSEKKITKILNTSSYNTPLWRLYNVHHMTRTYPAGARVDSSNYNPVLAWAMGCQLVALNFQTSDAPLLLNDGLFRQKGGIGYLAKPNSVLGKAEPGPPTDCDKACSAEVAPTTPSEDERDFLEGVMDSFEELACGDEATRKLLEKSTPIRQSLEIKEQQKKDKTPATKLKVRVLSASCLPKPKGAKSGEDIDPYVTVTVHDVVRGKDAKATYVPKSLSTSSVTNNGFCPVWNQREPVTFMVYSPDVAIVQFSLKEQDVGIDDKVADACIPINCLRKGYRSVELYDHNNTRSGAFGFARLLVEIQMYTA